MSEPEQPPTHGRLLTLAAAVHARLSMRHRESHTVFQTSTMAALLAGVYDGDVTVAELLTHGDFGVGTFNQLDGEMIILDGVCHHLHADGTAARAKNSDLTPFAAVTWFRPQEKRIVDEPLTRKELGTLVSSKIKSTNVIHAIKVTGRFQSIRTRTVARQRPPYPPLTEATKTQAESVLTDVDGTLAGFLTPGYEQGIAVAGYHLHFLAADHRRGGHDLDFVLESGAVEIDTDNDLHLSLPRTEAFRSATLSSESLDAEVRQAEGG